MEGLLGTTVRHGNISLTLASISQEQQAEFMKKNMNRTGLVKIKSALPKYH